MIRDCSRCGTSTTFPTTHLPRRGYWCGPCRSKASVESARKHRDRKRKNNNAYSARTSAKRALQTAAYRASHPDRRAAHQAVQTALRNGSLVKKACSVCGQSKAHAHHDDYTKPLAVLWLCHTHHMERHAMLKARNEAPT